VLLALRIRTQSFLDMRELNRDFKLADKKRLLDLRSLDEWRNDAYEINLLSNKNKVNYSSSTVG
jgi:hypothetical protein